MVKSLVPVMLHKCPARLCPGTNPVFTLHKRLARRCHLQHELICRRHAAISRGQHQTRPIGFPSKYDAVYEWSQKWEMPFNVTKCHAMAFNSRAVLQSYRLGTTNVLWVEETRYLGVTLQQNLKFNKHISEKVDKASRILSTIKHTV